MTAFALYGADGSLRILELAGREEWALSHILAAGDTGLANFHGTQVQGTWKVIFEDQTGTKTSVVNSVKLAIATA